MRDAPVDHPCRGVRACASSTADASLVYSGDTGPCEALVELAAGADVLLCEATWPHVMPGRWTEPPRGLHLSGRQAGEHAAAAGVGRLLLTHVPAWFDAAELLAEAQERFDGPVELVAPDATYGLTAGNEAGPDDLAAPRAESPGSSPEETTPCQTAAEPACPVQDHQTGDDEPASTASTERRP